MGTRKGVIKKTALSSFSNPRAGGIIAMGVEEGDAVIAVLGTDGKGEIFIGTHDGMAIRFEEGDVRPMGRTAYGVRGITLRDGDYVVAIELVHPGGTLLTVTERGYGKRTEIDEYRVQSRGGVGIINISTSDRNGHVVGVACVQDGDELLLITQQGMIIRMPTNDVRAIGRATQGVRLIDVEAEDGVVSVARLVEKEDESDTGAVRSQRPADRRVCPRRSRWSRRWPRADTRAETGARRSVLLRVTPPRQNRRAIGVHRLLRSQGTGPGPSVHDQERDAGRGQWRRREQERHAQRVGRVA